ncbi:hypothetical protein Alide_2697 [Alicycliphilus denitrificans BC]|nr:hypothetical protein Alide_2697 [Alicycliphilus denitrificans BC]
MCMGYAKDIRAWACTQEIGRREAALRQWGDLLHPEDDDAQVANQIQPPAVAQSAPLQCAPELAQEA